jgi:hypothetical protein
VLFVDTFLYQRPNTTQYPTCTRKDISTYRCTNRHGCLEPCLYLPSSHPSTYYASLRSFRFAHHPQPVAAAAGTVPNRTFCHETNLHQWFTDVCVPTTAPPRQLFSWYAWTVSVSAQPAERMSDVKPHPAPLATARFRKKARNALLHKPPQRGTHRSPTSSPTGNRRRVFDIPRGAPDPVLHCTTHVGGARRGPGPAVPRPTLVHPFAHC